MSNSISKVDELIFSGGSTFQKEVFTVFNEHLINIYSKVGDLIDQITCQGSRSTSCAFDPSGKLGLVVTETERGEIISFRSFGKALQIFKG